ncbi:hypothetical protein D9757_007106 [Collybiopsis confluens]|uniref:Uncharacterized protein n=1 Tax=Collybiopsis confluens TaxID=2823264 RepID=A0A8H5M4P0_9AGAR|nr:hypothetical protein D9757_007106 [Collybiopsis confluens]
MEKHVKVFVALQFIGAALFLAVMLTAALTPRVRRYATWYTFCISWILSSLSYTLVIVINAYSNGSNSDLLVGSRAWEVCLTQAALMYASPILTGFSSLAMCLHVLLYIRAALQVPMLQVKAITTTLLAVVPFIIYIIMFVVLFMVSGLSILVDTKLIKGKQLGRANPAAVQINPSGYYCHLELQGPGIAGSSVAILACVGVAVAETWMAVEVHRHHASLPRASQPMAFIIRVLLFGFVDLFTLIVGLLFLIPSARNRGNFLLSLIPLLGLLIFGSQNDILEVWKFWRRTPQQDATIFDATSPVSDDAGHFAPRRHSSHSSQRSRWRSSSQSYLDPTKHYRTSQSSSSRSLSVSIHKSIIVGDPDAIQKSDPGDRLGFRGYSMEEKRDGLNSDSPRKVRFQFEPEPEAERTRQ